MSTKKKQKIIPIYAEEALRKEYVFRNVPVMRQMETGEQKLFPCISFYRKIPLYHKEYYQYIATPHYETWYLNLSEAEGRSVSTLMKKAYTMCTFLNYVLYHTCCNTIQELTLQDIRGFIVFYRMTKEGKERNGNSWREGIGVVHSFLISYYEEYKTECSFLYRPQDLYTCITVHDPETNRTTVAKRYHKLAVAAPKITEKKYRFLVQDYLDMILLESKKHDPMLTLGIALQSYAGLREGEVVNLTRTSIRQIYAGFGRIGRIQIDLRDEAGFTKKWKGKTEFGSIKVYRIQEVYLDFIDPVRNLLAAHEEYLEGFCGQEFGKEAPLFLNEWGNPLSVASYKARVKKLFNEHFLPALKQLCRSNNIWAENAPYIEAYEKSYPGAHMFRHWFTMYLLTQAGLSAEEISKWRGDLQMSSMFDYIHVNTQMIELYKQSVCIFQKSVLEEIL